MRESTEMKHELREEFPESEVRIRKRGSSMHKAFDVYVSFLKDPDYQQYRELDEKLTKDSLSQEEMEEFRLIEAKIDYNEEFKRRVKKILSEYYNVRRNSRGEILSGGNTYLTIHRLERLN